MKSAQSLKITVILGLFLMLVFPMHSNAEKDLFSGEPSTAIYKSQTAFSKAAAAAETLSASALIRLATLSGDDQDEWYGRTIANLGDINNDGKADFAVSLPLANLDNDDKGDEGEVALYLSSATDLFRPAHILSGVERDEMYGWSVSGIGDFNNDGIDDFAVGAPSSAPAEKLSGRVEVFYGGNPFNAVADLKLTGESRDDRFGFSLDGGQDVNGDGIADLVVGAKFAGDEVYAPGRAYVFFGGTTPDAVADLILSGSSSGDEFGGSVRLAGDIDGDGSSDILIGASRARKKQGTVYVYRGGVALDNIADATLVGSATDSLFGRIINGGGRFNDDAYADVLISAPDDVVDETKTGKVYIYTGGPGPSLVLAAVLSGATEGSFFGFPAKWLPDLNGDTYSEIGVGAPLESRSGSPNGEHGSFALFWGGTALTTTPAVVRYGYEKREAFGTDFALIGDVTGDARLEIIIGSPLADIPDDEDDEEIDENAGIVSLFTYDPTLAKARYPVFELANRWFEGTVPPNGSAKAGDYDGNGIVDYRDLILLIRLPRR